MKKLLSLLTVALLVAFSGSAQAGVSNGDDAPEITFTKSWNGEQTKLSDFRGEVVLLVFWATW